MQNTFYWHLYNSWIFLDFCYIAKHWNSGGIKLLAGSVCFLAAINTGQTYDITILGNTLAYYVLFVTQ